jgi:hypothetical protein
MPNTKRFPNVYKCVRLGILIFLLFGQDSLIGSFDDLSSYVSFGLEEIAGYVTTSLLIRPTSPNAVDRLYN